MSVLKDKSNNTYYVTKRYKDWRGVSKRLFKRGFKTKKEAVKFEEDFMAKQSKSLDLTFEAFVDIYLNDIKKRIRRSTYITKSNYINTMILPYFKDLKMNQIGQSEVLQWQNEITDLKNRNGKEYCKSSLKTAHSQLVAIFNHAIKYYELDKNPAALVGTFKDDGMHEYDIWTLEEYKQFLDAVMDKPMSYMIYELLFWTGLREGEVLALTLSDIFFEDKMIRINKSYQRIEGEDVVDDPKTKASNRYVDMPEFLCEELKNYMNGLYKLKPEDRLFPVTKRYVEHEMERGCKLSGVKKIKVHDVRHVHSSILAHYGFSLTEISKRLGHKSIQMTRHYTHAYGKSGKEMAKVLESLVDEDE